MCRVFIVEDEGMVAMLLEDMLVDLGHEVVGRAASLQEATRLANELQIDLAILDLNLNGQQTYSLAAQLKTRGIPLVFATGYANVGLLQEWRGTPALQKPFGRHQLERAIGQALDHGWTQ